MIGKGWFPEQTGGLDRYFRALFEQLPGARAVVVGRDGLPGNDRDRDRVRGVSEHEQSLPLRLWGLTRAIQEEARSAAVIDVHFALYAFLPLLLGFFRHKTLIVHFHGPWADESVERGDTSSWRLRMRRALERFVYRRGALAITLTDAFKQVLVERYAVPPERVEVLAPGVDLERFSPGDRAGDRVVQSLPAEAFVVCCARRLVPRMGLPVLLDAWSQLLVLLGGCAVDPAPHLLIAGDGELRDELAARIAAEGLAGSVQLLGKVGDEALARLYSVADVNVVPSLSSEGFGLVVLEAAACGTPTIATRVGGLPEALAGLGANLIVEPADAGALARRLLAAAEGELPDRGHTRAWAQQWRWDLVGRRHLEVYASSLAGAHSYARRPLRVLRVADVSREAPGGIRGYMLFSGAALQERGHTLAYWFSEDLRVPVLSGGLRRLLVPWLIAARVLAAGRRFDIVEIHEPLAYGYAVIRALLPSSGLPRCVVMSYGIEERGWQAQRQRWRVRGGTPPLRSRISVPLTRLAPARLGFRHASAVLVPSSEDRDHLVGVLNVDASRVTYVPTGVTPDLFEVEPQPASAVGVLFVGSWIDRKGTPELVEAWQELQRRHGTAHLTLAGTGDGASKVLADFAEPVRQSVRVHPIVDRAQLRDLLRSHQIFVLPSWFEGMPLSLLEAAAAGLPCVASGVCGTADFIRAADPARDGGLLVPPHDAPALAAALERLLADPELRERLGNRARERASGFTWSHTAEITVDAYRGALAAPRHATPRRRARARL